MSNRLAAYIQDPEDVLDYTVDWSHWLETGDTLVDSTWTSSSVNMALSDDSFTTTTATVWVTFGVDAEEGDQYEAVNHITTDDGRQKDRTLFIKVETQ